jgi:hypothetical protein
MVLTVLSGCVSMLTKISANALQKALDKMQKEQQKKLEAQIKKYDGMPFDETIAAHFVGTWRNVSLTGVAVFSFSGDGIMQIAVRQFAGENPDNATSVSYKASKDMFAQRYNVALSEENSGPPTVAVSFFSYRFNNDYSELTFDNGTGLEYGLVYQKIDDKYTDTISAVSLDMPRSSSYTAGLISTHLWRQPDGIVKENQYADWSATFRVNSTKINGKEFGLFPPFNLPEGEYEIYFYGTITFRNALDSRELRISQTFHTTLKKGHIYEVKVYVEPRDMYLTLTLGPDRHGTLNTAVMLTEISHEQFEREYLQQ